jgi:hypothetical protein
MGVAVGQPQIFKFKINLWKLEPLGLKFTE